MPKDHRKIAIAEHERKIVEYTKAIGFIAEIPLNTVSYVVRPHYRIEKNKAGITSCYWADSGDLIYPFRINLGSFRCRILGIELPGPTADRLIKYEKENTPYNDALKFLDIRSWKPFKPDDAGLYVNWAVLSEEFKQIAFGK